MEVKVLGSIAMVIEAKHKLPSNYVIPIATTNVVMHVRLDS
jgi:hypothetical protein